MALFRIAAMDDLLTSRPRILVIADDPALGSILAEVLGSAGYGVAVDGDPAAFALVLSTRPLPDCPVPCVGLATPLRMASLLTAIEQALAAGAEIRLGRWRFDPVARLLVDGGDKVRLTDKEAAILTLLRDSDGVVGRDELLEQVWGYGADIDTHTLETHIYRLRQKIEADPAEASVLLTEAGGYRLNRES